MSDRPIGDYGLLSDCRSAALVSSQGSVDWLCFPRFDSPAVFSRLLGKQAGRWVIRPVGGAGCTRRYVGPSLVLESTYRTTAWATGRRPLRTNLTGSFLCIREVADTWWTAAAGSW